MTSGTTANAPASPVSAEQLGVEIARRATGLGITAVVCWDTCDDAVVAHVVARELGSDVYYAVVDAGRIYLESALPAQAQVAVVAASFGDDLGLTQLAAVVRAEAGRVAAVAARELPASSRELEAAGAQLIV